MLSAMAAIPVAQSANNVFEPLPVVSSTSRVLTLKEKDSKLCRLLLQENEMLYAEIQDLKHIADPCTTDSRMICVFQQRMGDNLKILMGEEWENSMKTTAFASDCGPKKMIMTEEDKHLVKMLINGRPKHIASQANMKANVTTHEGKMLKGYTKDHKPVKDMKSNELRPAPIALDINNIPVSDAPNMATADPGTARSSGFTSGAMNSLWQEVAEGKDTTKLAKKSKKTTPKPPKGKNVSKPLKTANPTTLNVEAQSGSTVKTAEKPSPTFQIFDRNQSYAFQTQQTRYDPTGSSPTKYPANGVVNSIEYHQYHQLQQQSMNNSFGYPIPMQRANGNNLNMEYSGTPSKPGQQLQAPGGNGPFTVPVEISQFGMSPQSGQTGYATKFSNANYNDQDRLQIQSGVVHGTGLPDSIKRKLDAQFMDASGKLAMVEGSQKRSKTNIVPNELLPGQFHFMSQQTRHGSQALNNLQTQSQILASQQTQQQGSQGGQGKAQQYRGSQQTQQQGSQGGQGKAQQYRGSQQAWGCPSQVDVGQVLHADVLETSSQRDDKSSHSSQFQGQDESPLLPKMSQQSQPPQSTSLRMQMQLQMEMQQQRQVNAQIQSSQGQHPPHQERRRSSIFSQQQMQPQQQLNFIPYGGVSDQMMQQGGQAQLMMQQQKFIAPQQQQYQQHFSTQPAPISPQRTRSAANPQQHASMGMRTYVPGQTNSSAQHMFQSQSSPYGQFSSAEIPGSIVKTPSSYHHAPALSQQAQQDRRMNSSQYAPQLRKPQQQSNLMPYGNGGVGKKLEQQQTFVNPRQQLHQNSQQFQQQDQEQQGQYQNRPQQTPNTNATQFLQSWPDPTLGMYPDQKK
eukprot:CFRG0821T1